ncbi:hypothetical protein FGG08_005922 [Glutinoglossum americanum]|uniref:Lethal giant larvae (Lgl)-like C-terminal domain-containing protein n=1 Tax=Glutinoglossum americanum TaxID=1670608 RepID=A0A9P8I210_9PEZI|nr:hypothetical protein FGG08_005922 [Glutinoglossum americanum]
MAHFLRGKQAGIQNDLSAGLGPEVFILDDSLDQIARYGINSRISTVAYDPVQSLLAVGTGESPYGSGQIYVFGQKRVCVTLNLQRKASVKILEFCADKIISVDSKNNVAIYSLDTKRIITNYVPPGFVTAVATDPSLDWMFLGLQNGDIVAYDLDREVLSPFRIPNLWRERSPKARVLPIVTLALHPRDIGSLLIGYTEGAVIFSFKQNKPTKFFQYELPRGAPGGDSDPASVNSVRQPRLTQALWHPTGTFILTGHEDSSMVIWDPKDGRVVVARTLQDVNVNIPGAGIANYGMTPGTFSLKEPLFRIAWCSRQNPDDTGLLIAGGAPTTMPTKGLTFLELGLTPNYSTSSWQILSDHFASPKRQRIFPTPPNAEVIDFCLIPRSSPYYAGACDPVAVLALLSSGELVTLSFPSGQPIPPTNNLHLSLSLVHPFAHRTDFSAVKRERWLGMIEKRNHFTPIVIGGAGATHPLKRYQNRGIVQTAHGDGTIRLWDAGHGDEIENEDLLQIDISQALRRLDDVEATHMSMSGVTGEFAAGLRTGEVVVFRWGRNANFGREAASLQLSAGGRAEGLMDIRDRADPTLKEGLLPLTMFVGKNDPVSALKLSDVGFLGVGYETGGVAIVDLRGPTVIYNASLSDVITQSKRGSLRRSVNQGQPKSEWPTVLEFGVMSLEGDDYSSILLFVGTNLGHAATFKLLPQPTGVYTVQFVGSASLDDRVITLCPLNVETGASACASQTAVAGLREGVKVPGVLLSVTQTGTRIFKPASAKGAHKTWDEFLCESSAVAEADLEGGGHALIGIFNDGCARAYSIPGLKEIGSADLKNTFDPKRLAEAIITGSGDILGWAGPSQLALVNVWGAGKELQRSQDRLYNPEAIIPPRPTISNLQWMAGTQYISAADMDILIGGPDRPMSRRMIEKQRATDIQQQLQSPPPPDSQQGEGYWAYMQRQVNERTEKLNIVGDSMDKLEESSSGFAEDVGKFVSNQKKKMILGSIKGKWF